MKALFITLLIIAVSAACVNAGDFVDIDDTGDITSYTWDSDEKCERVVKCEICGKEIVEEYDCFIVHDLYSVTGYDLYWPSDGTFPEKEEITAKHTTAVCPHCHHKYDEKWQDEFKKLGKRLLKQAQDDEWLRRAHHEKMDNSSKCDELRKEGYRLLDDIKEIRNRIEELRRKMMSDFKDELSDIVDGDYTVDYEPNRDVNDNDVVYSLEPNRED